MGWSSGTDVAEVFESLLLKYVPKEKLKEEAEKALYVLEDQDWDCTDEIALFDYIAKQRMLDDNDLDDYYISKFRKDCDKYKKQFGF